jgi:hypothetical protein
MKKVVSFCLWGTNPHYLDGALHALATARQFYPGVVVLSGGGRARHHR